MSENLWETIKRDKSELCTEEETLGKVSSHSDTIKWEKNFKQFEEGN